MAVRTFLSYSSEDKEVAADIQQHLRRFGFEAFLAHNDIEPSEEWQQRIISELKACQVFIPILTDNFTESAWTDQEVGFALSRDVLIIPLNAGINPYGFIGKIQALTVAPRDIERTCVSIAEIVVRRKQFNKDIVRAIIQTFGESDSYEEAKRNSSYLLKFKHLLNTRHISQIKKLAANNEQIRRSYGAQDNLAKLMSNFK